MHLKSPPVASAAVRSKAVVLLLIYCFMCLQLFVGVLCWSLFCMHCFMSFLAIQLS